MNIFVTVGTTAFDELVKFIDQEHFFNSFNVIIQYGPGQFIPTKRHCFAYSDTIEKEYLAADFVITHGGAGTIYRLLELQVPFCAVPNLERIDDHQLDISRNLSQRNFMFSVEKISDLPALVEKFSKERVSFDKFYKDAFFAAEEIADYILKS